MDVRVATLPLARARAKAALVFARKGESIEALVREAGQGFSAQAALLARRDAFAGDPGQVLVLHQRAGARIETVVVVGPGGGTSADEMRSAAAEGARAARDAGADSLAVLLPVSRSRALSPEGATEIVVEGVRLGLYVFDRYKAERAKRAVVDVTILVRGSAARAARKGLEVGTILADSVLLARDLGNEPGNGCTPTSPSKT